MNSLYLWIDAIFGLFVVAMVMDIYSKTKNNKDNMQNNEKEEIEIADLEEIELADLEEIELADLTEIEVDIKQSNSNKQNSHE